MIPHSKPLVGNKEYRAVRQVLASGQLAQGREVAQLESEFCTFTGHRSALAVSSGTTALYCALKALGVSRDDRVILPSFACTALANAVHMCNAVPVLCDVDDETGLVTTDLVKAALVKKTKAVIVPHLFGFPAPAHSIEAELGIPVVEDCAQCIGATIDGKKVGSLSSIAIFSFYATKVIGAGEGGLVTTTDAAVARRLQDLREYDHRNVWEPRSNSKCSDVHAAIARVQLSRLEAFVRRRRGIAERFTEKLTENKLCEPFPVNKPNVEPMYFRYILRTRSRARTMVMNYFHDCGIACARPVFKPFHHYGKGRKLPATDRLFRELLSIPIYPALTDEQCCEIETALGGLNKISG